MENRRASGILLHPTSLPGSNGIGDLGDYAFKFVDFLERAKQTYWQILPLGPTGWGDSPYASFSAFAGNTLLISPEKLVEDGLLPESGIETIDSNSERVDYGAVYELKNRMLRNAFENFANASDDLQHAFDAFTQENASWLEDYALFRAIKASQDQKPWYEWDEPLKLRDEKSLAEISNILASEIRAEKFYQFLFFRQWFAVKSYANERGVRIVGDVPIFVALDSADVWHHREFFKLNDNGSPRVVSGVPPDFFSKTGQLWGNPIYDWETMANDGFGWWIERIRSALRTVDILRIDHFRGFGAAWEVPGGDATAEHGEWVDAPGRELFTAVKDALGDPPFWVEDLGFMTPEIEALRDDFAFLGMRILQFAFGGDAHNEALPHNYIHHCITYTGTHDNDTVVGWWNSQPPDSPAREHCMRYLNTDGSEINWDLIRSAWSSVADVAIAPLQDVLGLGNEARMNLPASTSGNWQWRFTDGALSDEIADRLRELTEIYGRVSAG
ncbi:MAG: 4-alpha-glucanotransferase [Acidobacteria bacterium]|nr:MAG: 4-alpha-glucanotransferase [Acidobacteriota bacterium]